MTGQARAFLVVGGLLVLAWAATGGGYFWPAWPLSAWLIGLAGNAAYQSATPSDEPSQTP